MNLTILIIIVTVVISYNTFNNQYKKAKWLFIPTSIKRNKEWYRFLSHGFIHADWGHLLFNMLTLLFFAPILENSLLAYYDNSGYLIFILYYLSAIIVSSIYSYITNMYNDSYASLGASGGVSAILFATIALNPTMGIGLLFIPIHIPAFIFGIMYIIYSHHMAKRNMDNIGHDAHLHGALYGFVLLFILIPSQLNIFIDAISNWKL